MYNTTKTEDNQQNDNSNSTPINNYLNVNGLKSPIKRHRVAKQIFFKSSDTSVRDSL